jgi:DNA-binding CsgD family transcriptional regulator
VGPDHPAGALRSASRALSPQPLSVDAIARLVPGRDPKEAHDASGGNPLLAVEIARAPAGVALADIGPESVGLSVLSRVRSVSPDAVALAEAVALFPTGATLEDAAAVAGLQPAAAARAADGLIAASVLEAGERLAFLHPVMRTAVYEQRGAFARRQGHGAAARVLRDRDAPLESVAAHLLLAAPGGDPDNVRILTTAAADALAAAAPRAAIRYLERALEEPVPAGLARFEVLFELGRLQARVGRPDSIDSLRRAADAAPDPRAHARASIHLAAVQLAHYEVRDALAVLEALRGAELGAEDTLYVDGLIIACALEFDMPDMVKEVAARLPRDLPGDTAAQRLALWWRWMNDNAGATDTAVLLQELLRCMADDGSIPFSEYGLTTFDPAPSLTMLGAFDHLEQIAEERLAAARDRGDEADYVTALTARATSLQLRGHWLAAESDIRRALESPALTDDQRVTALAQLVEVLARQLRVDEAEEAVARIEALGSATWRVEMMRAVIADAVGVASPYIEHFKNVTDYQYRMGWRYPPQRRWLCSYADGLIRNGRPDEARTVIEKYLQDAEPTGEPASIGQALTTLGRLERGDRAIEVLERAVAILDPSPHEWLRGWAHLELGAALRRAKRRAESREHLKRALAYAEEHGEASIAKRAREEIKLAGGRTREAAGRDRDALTPAEERVARLAADGYSNKAIAAELFLTVGSVQTTMIRVFRKLGIHSRKDLPGAIGA